MVDDLITRVHSAGGAMMEDVNGDLFFEFSSTALRNLIDSIHKMYVEDTDKQLQELARKWMDISLRQQEELKALRSRRFACPICAGEMGAVQ